MGLFDRLFEHRTSVPSPPVAPSPSAAAGTPPRQMAKIKEFASGSLPEAVVKEFIVDVNNLIDQYNTGHDSARKAQILQDIQEKIKQVDYIFPPSLIANSPGYRQAHAALFNEIKYQLASLGRPSLRQPHERASPLAEIISNMAPDKADALLAILVKGNNPNLATELGGLYGRDDKSDEAKRFHNFLSTHQMTYLGGGNSKNFKVTNTRDSSESVLKVDCRLDMPRNVEAHLRGALREGFTPIDAERLVTCNDSAGKPMTRTLLVTDYCPGGSLIDERAQLHNAEKIADTLCDRFAQMAETMLSIQQAGCMFPDAKATNWLVDEHGKLRLADTKSFLFTDRNGNYSARGPGNERAGFLSTKAFNPPEFSSGSKRNADHVHAFILGKNLHYYATGKHSNKKTDGHEFDYSDPVFSTVKGREIKTLIEALVKPKPAERMPVKDALNTLTMIRPEYAPLFKDLHDLKSGPHDEKMDAFIMAKQQQLIRANPAEKVHLFEALKTTVKGLKDDKALKEVSNIVNHFRKNAGLFTVGMKAKADRIEAAMANVPVEQRQNFLQSGAASQVLEALASHRHVGKRGNVYLNEQGQIDLERAAATFKEFKKTFADQMGDIASRHKDSPDHDDGPKPPHMGRR